MSIRGWQAYVQDIIDAGREILEFTHNLDFESFSDDIRTMRAVSLNFIVIGEAANRIPDTIQEIYPEVPWQMMRAMRNRLVHAYFEIDPKLVWDTVNNDLPSLLTKLENLVNKEDMDA